MASMIRVRTLFLPVQDWLASYILSNPEYKVLINERQMTKSGEVIMHLQYEDNMNLGFDNIERMLYIKHGDIAQSSEMKQLENDLLDIHDIECGDYEPDELKSVPDKKKSGRKKK